MLVEQAISKLPKEEQAFFKRLKTDDVFCKFCLAYGLDLEKLILNNLSTRKRVGFEIAYEKFILLFNAADKEKKNFYSRIDWSNEHPWLYSLLMTARTIVNDDYSYVNEAFSENTSRYFSINTYLDKFYSARFIDNTELLARKYFNEKLSEIKKKLTENISPSESQNTAISEFYQFKGKLLKAIADLYKISYKECDVEIIVQLANREKITGEELSIDKFEISVKDSMSVENLYKAVESQYKFLMGKKEAVSSYSYEFVNVKSANEIKIVSEQIYACSLENFCLNLKKLLDKYKDRFPELSQKEKDELARWKMIEDLKKENGELATKVTTLEGEKKLLDEQINSKDAEIERLVKELEAAMQRATEAEGREVTETGKNQQEIKRLEGELRVVKAEGDKLRELLRNTHKVSSTRSPKRENTSEKQKEEADKAAGGQRPSPASPTVPRQGSANFFPSAPEKDTKDKKEEVKATSTSSVSRRASGAAGT